MACTKFALAISIIRLRPAGVSTQDYVELLRSKIAANADPFADIAAVFSVERELFGCTNSKSPRLDAIHAPLPVGEDVDDGDSPEKRGVDSLSKSGGSPITSDNSQLKLGSVCTDDNGASQKRPNDNASINTSLSEAVDENTSEIDDSSKLSGDAPAPAPPEPLVSPSGCASLQFLQSVTRLQRAVSGRQPPPTDAELDTALDTVLRHVAAAADGADAVWLSLHHGLQVACRVLAARPRLLTAAQPTALGLLERLLESVLSPRDLSRQMAQLQQSRLLLTLGAVPPLAAPLLVLLTDRLAAAAAHLQQEHRRALLGLPPAGADTAAVLENSHYTLTMLETLLQSAAGDGQPQWAPAVRRLRAELERASLFICDRHPAFVRFLWRLLRLTQTADELRSRTHGQTGLR